MDATFGQPIQEAVEKEKTTLVAVDIRMAVTRRA